MVDGVWPSSRSHCSPCEFTSVSPAEQDVLALYEMQLVKLYGEGMESGTSPLEVNCAAPNANQLKRHQAARHCAEMIREGLCEIGSPDRPEDRRLRIVE